MLVDIHSHILPGLDDGAEDWDTTLEMAGIAAGDGIGYMFATPHYRPGIFMADSQRIEELAAAFMVKLEEKQIPLQIIAGNELYLNKNLPDWLEKRSVKQLGRSRYVLVEFPMDKIPDDAEDVLYEISIAGFTPILAHPERYREVLKDTDVLLPFIEDGILLQMNSGSVLGQFGTRVQKTAEELLHRRMIHLVGSDAHNSQDRPPKMKAAYNTVCILAGMDYAKEIFCSNGLAVVEDKEVKVREVSKKIREGYFYKWLRG